MSRTLDPTGLTNPIQHYPWDLWLDGKPHIIKDGGDVPINSFRTFRTYVYRVAKRRGLKVVAGWHYDDTLCIQAYAPDAPRPLLPSPYGRLANGQYPGQGPAHRRNPDFTPPTGDGAQTEDAVLPDGTPTTREDYFRTTYGSCSRCNAPLTNDEAKDAGECRRLDPNWRCHT